VFKRAERVLLKFAYKIISRPLSSMKLFTEFLSRTWSRAGFSLSSEALLIGTYNEVRRKLEIIGSKGVQEVMLYIPLLYKEPGVLEEYVKNLEI